MTVRWSRPHGWGQSAITKYVATLTPGHRRCVVRAGAATTYECAFHGLVQREQYAVRVVAMNAAANGAAATLGATTTGSRTPEASATPGTPVSVAVVPADSQLNVSWSPPPSNAAPPITGYRVFAVAASSTTTCQPQSASTLSCTIDGLVNATTYSVTVVAINAVGAGSASSPPVTSAPALAPGAPTGVSVTPADGALNVNWVAPTSDGGSVVLSYEATATHGDSTVACPSTSNQGCTINGLANGTAYQVNVFALNDVGGSSPSLTTVATPSPSGPDAPQHVAVTAGNDQLAVAWDAPAFANGRSTSYVATASAPSGAHFSCVTTTLSCIITSSNGSGPLNGTAYAVSVIATIDGASAPPSTVVAATPATVPLAPSALHVTPGNKLLIVNWHRSASRGSSLTGYIATATAPGAEPSSCTTSSLSCVINNLHNGVAYQVHVVGRCASGSSAPSIVQSSVPTATGVLPVITLQPVSVTADVAGTVRFASKAKVARATTLRVRWQVSVNHGHHWSDVYGASSTTYTLHVLSSEAGHEYRAVFTDAAGEIATDGALLNVPRNELTTSNWSGYVAQGSNYTSVTATWSVPYLLCAPGETSFVSEWVGLDGYGSATVEQDGVIAACVDGQASYSAWYEIFGDPSLNGGAASTWPRNVAPGDVITATVSVANGQWTMQVADVPSGVGASPWTASVQIPSPLSTSVGQSAEWIIERPEVCASNFSECALVNLSDFTSTSFSDATVTQNGVLETIAQSSALALRMQGNVVRLDTTGALSGDGTGFIEWWKVR